MSIAAALTDDQRTRELKLARIRVLRHNEGAKIIAVISCVGCKRRATVEVERGPLADTFIDEAVRVHAARCGAPV